MRLDIRPGGILFVRLSARNLSALYAKLSQPDSYRAIVNGAVYTANGELLTNTLLVVQAEPDEIHYRNRPEPGPMSPETETIMGWIDNPEAWA